MEETPQISTPIKPKKTNLPLIIILSILIITIIGLIIAIIIINIQPASETSGETPLEAEIEESINDATEPSKETSTLDCTRDMTAEEIAEFSAVSGKIEIVADFNSDDFLGNIAIYKTTIGPSTDAENPDAPGDEFLVENSNTPADKLTSSDYVTYYLAEEDTTKPKAKSSWTSQGFICKEN